MFFTEDEVLIG